MALIVACQTGLASNIERFFGGADQIKVVASPDAVRAWQTVGSLMTPPPMDMEKAFELFKAEQLTNPACGNIDFQQFVTKKPNAIQEQFSVYLENRENQYIQSFQMKAGNGVAVPTNLVAELSAILLDEKSYSWGFTDGCTHFPCYVITFTKGTNIVNVSISLECTEVRSRPDEFANLVGSAQDKVVQIMKEVLKPDSASPARSDGPAEKGLKRQGGH